MKTNAISIALKDTKKYVVLLIIFSASISYLTLQIAVYVKYAIDGIVPNRYELLPSYISMLLTNDCIRNLLIIAGIIIAINFIIMFMSYIRDIITSTFKLKINSNLKQTLYNHILNLEYETYMSYDKSEIIQRINDDSEVYSNFFNSQFNLILDIIFLSIFIINQSIELNIGVTVYIVITIIIMILFAFWYFRRLNKKVEEIIVKRKKLLTATMINVNNMKMLRMFNKQKAEKRNYKKLNYEYAEKDIELIKLILFYEIVNDHISYLANPIIFLLGGIAVIKGQMTLGSIVVLANFASKIFNCFLNIGANLETIDDFYVVTKKLNKLLSLKEEDNSNYSYDLNGDIIFIDVTIYADNKPILKNMNFRIKHGEKVAIIGDNGSGKSILAKAILGLYNYDGNIYINNHNIKRLNKSDIRRTVELIIGDSYIFSGSILDNILLNEKVEMSRIREVTEDCEIYSDIERFNNKYNTLVGDKGTKLSGGQKQRLCIARSLIKNKPIMIFDEALNKIDNTTREKILINLKEKYNDKTIIFITHNLDIEKYVDKIIHVNNETVVEECKNEK